MMLHLNRNSLLHLFVPRQMRVLGVPLETLVCLAHSLRLSVLAALVHSLFLRIRPHVLVLPALLPDLLLLLIGQHGVHDVDVRRNEIIDSQLINILLLLVLLQRIVYHILLFIGLVGLFLYLQILFY